MIMVLFSYSLGRQCPPLTKTWLQIIYWCNYWYPKFRLKAESNLNITNMFESQFEKYNYK